MILTATAAQGQDFHFTSESYITNMTLLLTNAAIIPRSLVRQKDYRQSTFRAHIKAVYDADTVTADIHLGLRVVLRDQKLRLFGINAPEMRGPEKPKGIISRDALRKWVLAKDVTIEVPKKERGKYGRILATIWLDGSNINEKLVVQGFAKRASY